MARWITNSVGQKLTQEEAFRKAMQYIDMLIFYRHSADDDGLWLQANAFLEDIKKRFPEIAELLSTRVTPAPGSASARADAWQEVARVAADKIKTLEDELAKCSDPSPAAIAALPRTQIEGGVDLLALAEAWANASYVAGADTYSGDAHVRREAAKAAFIAALPRSTEGETEGDLRSAVAMLGEMGDALVAAGCQPGPREQQLENIRVLIGQRDAMSAALKRITFMARTSGGWKPDKDLMDACEQAEALLTAAPAAGASGEDWSVQAAEAGLAALPRSTEGWQCVPREWAEATIESVKQFENNPGAYSHGTLLAFALAVRNMLSAAPAAGAERSGEDKHD